MESWSRQNENVVRKPRGNAEHDEQVVVFAVLALNESRYPALKWIHAIPNGGARAKAVAGKLKAEGVKSGISDMFVPIPVGGFHGMYIEMKAGKNTLSANQREFAEFVKCNRYNFLAAWSSFEALSGIEAYLGIKLRGKV